MASVIQLPAPVVKNAIELAEDKNVSYFNNVKFYSKSYGIRFTWKDIVLFVRKGYLYLFNSDSKTRPAFKVISLTGYNKVLRPIPPKEGTYSWQFIIMPLESMSQRAKIYYFCPTRSDDRKTWMMHILNNMAIANDANIDKVIKNECTKEKCELDYDVLETSIYVDQKFKRFVRVENSDSSDISGGTIQNESRKPKSQVQKADSSQEDNEYEIVEDSDVDQNMSAVEDVDDQDDGYLKMNTNHKNDSIGESQDIQTKLNSLLKNDSSEKKTLINKPKKSLPSKNNSSFDEEVNSNAGESWNTKQKIDKPKKSIPAKEVSTWDEEVSKSPEESWDSKQKINKPKKSVPAKEVSTWDEEANFSAEKTWNTKQQIDKPKKHLPVKEVSSFDEEVNSNEEESSEYYYSCSNFYEDAKTANLILTNKSPGTYLLRIENNGRRVLQVKFDKIHKFEVTFNPQNEQYYIKPKDMFPTLEYLLHHYHQHDICEKGKLTCPYKLA